MSGTGSAAGPTGSGQTGAGHAGGDRLPGGTRGGGVVGLVVPGADGGIVAHVRSLLARLPGLGWEVRVCGPAAVLGRLTTVPLPGVRLVAVEVAATARAVLDRRPTSGRPLLGRPLQGRSLLGRSLEGRSLEGRPLLGRPLHVRPRGDLARAFTGVDVVSAQGLRAGHAALGALPPTVGLVVTWHNPPPTDGLSGLIGPAVARRVARGATLTLAASNDLVAEAVAAGAPAADLLEVAAPARPAGDPARAAALRRHLRLDGHPLVVTAGRLTRQKDHPTAIRALLQIPAHRRPVLAIAGDGPDRAALAALAGHLGVGLRLLGERADIADLLLAADAAVLSSRWEARSLFAQEALRAGVPLVATAVGGLPDLVGDAALLVTPGTPALLGGALDRILTDRALRGRLVGAGRSRAADWPDEDHTARAVAAALERVRLLAWDSVER